jgi:hypothetical protein
MSAKAIGEGNHTGRGNATESAIGVFPFRRLARDVTAQVSRFKWNLEREDESFI